MNFDELTDEQKAKARAAHQASGVTPDALEVVRVADGDAQGYGVVVEWVRGMGLDVHVSFNEADRSLAVLAEVENCDFTHHKSEKLQAARVIGPALTPVTLARMGVRSGAYNGRRHRSPKEISRPWTA